MTFFTNFLWQELYNVLKSICCGGVHRFLINFTACGDPLLFPSIFFLTLCGTPFQNNDAAMVGGT